MSHSILYLVDLRFSVGGRKVKMKVGSYDDEKAGASNQEIKLRRGLHRELQYVPGTFNIDWKFLSSFLSSSIPPYHHTISHFNYLSRRDDIILIYFEYRAFDLRFTLAHYTNLCPYSPSLPRRAQLSRSRDYWHTQHSVPYPMETAATEDVKLCNTY